MKAQTSFLMKGIYLILVLVTVSIVLNQIANLNLTQATQQKELDFRNIANDILETLTGSVNCLAYKETGEAEYKPVDLSLHRVVDINKLNNFASVYADIEPECARNFKFRYQIKVEKFNLTRLFQTMPGEIPYPGNRDIVIIFDNSESMNQQNRLATAKEAALEFLKCAGETDRVGIVTFRDICHVEQKANLTLLGSLGSSERANLASVIASIDAKSGTPLINSIEKTKEVLKGEATDPSRVKMVVLLTDGRETCCPPPPLNCNCEKYPCGTTACRDPCKDKLCDVAKKAFSPSSFPPSGVPVFTIGFMVDAQGEKELKCVAEKTNGKYFYADIDELVKIFCEIARGKIEPEESETWYFGAQTHSLGDALKSTISLSIPVSIRINDVKTQPGQITINIYNGELEELSGIVDRSCLLNIKLEENIFVSYRTYGKTVNNENFLCMRYQSGEFCSKLSCTKSLEFPQLSPGSYRSKVVPEPDKIRVVV
jgi:hypothetical protein